MTPGTINAPLLGDPVPENNKPYTIVKINYVKDKRDRKPQPLLPKKGDK